jgi:membrane protein YdbS with pleckstrin-like domain
MTPLDKGQLWVMRVHAGAFAVLLLLAGAVAETVLHDRLAIPRGAILLPLLLVCIWIVFFAPARRFSRWGYTMDGEELQVQHGLITQIHTVVPLDRVQHLDIAQGPLERSFGVSRLIVHTAGTLHSQILLPGLKRDTAEAMRDEIRARIRLEAE